MGQGAGWRIKMRTTQSDGRGGVGHDSEREEFVGNVDEIISLELEGRGYVGTRGMNLGPCFHMMSSIGDTRGQPSPFRDDFPAASSPYYLDRFDLIPHRR